MERGIRHLEIPNSQPRLLAVPAFATLIQMPIDCSKFSSYILQRTLNFQKKMLVDRQPFSTEYAGLYPSDVWENFTGSSHTYDQLHVGRFNDDGCWEQIDESNCTMAICDPEVKAFGWGMTRADFGKFRRKYKSPVFCLDQWRNFREAKQALDKLVDGMGLNGMGVFSDFMRLFSLRSTDKVFVVNDGADPSAPFTEVEMDSTMFTNNCTNLTLGLTPAEIASIGQISMRALMRLVNRLNMDGYIYRQFNPGNIMPMFMDDITMQKLQIEDPALFERFKAEDFAKGGKFYAYGAATGAGNYLFKLDMTPIRYTDIGGGVLQRVMPWENINATIGKAPNYATAYEMATYQLYHIYNTQSRRVYMGETEQINPEMPFLNRDLAGKWKWHRPEANFSAPDPCTGEVCEYDGTDGNKGFWTAEWEVGVQTEYPKIERWILAARQPQTVGPNPLCGTPSPLLNYYPYPYNCLCEQE